MKQLSLTSVLPTNLSRIEKWLHPMLWLLGLVVLNWPGQQITIGLFGSSEFGLLIPGIYGTLINAAIVYGVINLMLENAGGINAKVMLASFVLFLYASGFETLVDVAYLLIGGVVVNWIGLIDIVGTNLVIHFFFFYAPALIYGVIKSSNHVERAEVDKIEIQDGHNKVLVSPHELSHLESDGNYVKFHTDRGVILERSSLINVESRLPTNFIRCHKSFIINQGAIEKITATSVVVRGHKIPVGRKYKENLR